MFVYLDEHCTKYVKVAFSPPNSLDMNVLDFGIWGDLEARAWENNP